MRGIAKRSAPRLHRARAWVAPRVERGGRAFQDTIAPKISGLLSTAARKLDPAPPPRQRQWPRVLAGAIVLTAAAGAAGAAVTVVRRRRASNLVAAPSEDAETRDYRAGQNYQTADADLDASPAHITANGQLQPSS